MLLNWDNYVNENAFFITVLINKNSCTVLFKYANLLLHHQGGPFLAIYGSSRRFQQATCGAGPVLSTGLAGLWARCRACAGGASRSQDWPLGTGKDGCLLLSPRENQHHLDLLLFTLQSKGLINELPMMEKRKGRKKGWGGGGSGTEW